MFCVSPHTYMPRYIFFFFFNDTATTEIYTLSLHDALPIWRRGSAFQASQATRKFSPNPKPVSRMRHCGASAQDRKSTRLNSSHSQISYAVFCLKKKKEQGQLRNSETRKPHDHEHSQKQPSA